MAKAAIAFAVYPFISASVFWGCLAAIGGLMWTWPQVEGPYHSMTFGTPLIMLAFALTVTIQIGLMGRDFPDDRREWFGRMGAWIAIMSQIGPVVLAVTTSLHIDFLRKPQLTDLMARTRMLKLGRRLAVVDVDLYSRGETELVAKAQVTYSIPPSPTN